ARISLISKSNIRYVGTLHEINSETSTVALEQVVSHGTEGRRGGDNEIAGSDNVYEYIVFRGSDVKDLRIEEPAQKKPPPPPPQLDDPAILGQSTTRPYAPPGAPFQQQPPPPMGMPPYYQFPPPQHRGFGPSPYQSAGMFGAYPAPLGGQSPMGMPGPGLAHQQQQPQQQQQQPQPQQPPQPVQQPQQAIAQQPPTGPQNRAPPQAPIGPSANRQPSGPVRQPQVSTAPQQALKQPELPTPSPTNCVPASQQPSRVEGANAQPKLPEPTQAASVAPTPSAAPTGPKARGSIVPALPRTSPARPPVASATPTVPANNVTVPLVPHSKSDASTSAAVRDLADKVNRLAVSAANAAAKTTAAASAPTSTPEVQTTIQQSRPPRQQPGTGNFVAGRGRGSFRGGFNQTRRVEVPATDFDFQSNNEKFNKQDLVKEAIASGTDESTHYAGKAGAEKEALNGGDGAADTIVIPPPPKDGFYNKKSSFFDNISCENKERAEAVPGERRGGAQFRSEEQKKNLETFGQGSVDGYGSGYRGGWRTRGRGRGNYRGRSFGAYNRNSYRAQQQAGAAAGN
ncbi:Scd6-like Sm domain-containing protein, partial [Sphaerosporella brunnea]